MDALPFPFRRSVAAGSPISRLVVIQSSPRSHATILALQIVEELRRLALLGVNYVNIGSPWQKLCYRYPSLRRHFMPIDENWLERPSMRQVPRTRLENLLEWIVMGGKGVQVPDQREDTSSPILPDFERLWDFVERCRQIPALVVVDTIEALAAHYGVDPRDLVEVLEKDFVETGYAHALLVFEGRVQPSWFNLADAILRFVPIRTPRKLPQWLLTIEGISYQPRRYVMTFDRGRLAATPSHDETVRMIEHGHYRIPGKGIPTEVLEVFQDQGDLSTAVF